MNAAGTYVRELSTPAIYTPTANASSGIRTNLAFESLSFSSDGLTIYTATENALFQDGAAAGLANGSWVRFQHYNLASGAALGQYAYEVDPVVAAPIPAASFATNGLVEILALDATRFLSVERSFSNGIGNAIRLYLTDLAGASDVSGIASLGAGGFAAMSKSLVLDLDDLGIVLDNIEGISWGPTLANGNRSLVLVSDNNFSPGQFTQFLAFEVTQPVPEPSNVVLLVAGIAIVVPLARRRGRLLASRS
jgi:3-phytase/alkaline phosphatase D